MRDISTQVETPTNTPHSQAHCTSLNRTAELHFTSVGSLARLVHSLWFGLSVCGLYELRELEIELAKKVGTALHVRPVHLSGRPALDCEWSTCLVVHWTW